MQLNFTVAVILLRFCEGAKYVARNVTDAGIFFRAIYFMREIL